MSPVRVSLKDRLLAVLTEHGPLTTGRLRRLTGPHYQTTDVARRKRTSHTGQVSGAEQLRGDLWIRLDPAVSEELTRGVEL